MDTDEWGSTGNTQEDEVIAEGSRTTELSLSGSTRTSTARRE